MENQRYDIDLIEKAVSKVMNERRFIHTLGVKDMCFSLALVHECDEEKAIVAGLLHDCAKCLSDDVLLRECEKYNITISEYERKAPFLLHAKLGAYYAKVNYHVNDTDIWNAITYHTTGRPNMSTLEKIVYVADYIEPGRKSSHIPNLKEIRKLAFVDLDKTVSAILSNTINYLNSKSNVIDTTTMDAYNYYK